MSEDNVTPFAARARRSTQTFGVYREVVVGGKHYRLMPRAGGFVWIAACGHNALGEDDWREVSGPTLVQVTAALYAAS